MLLGGALATVVWLTVSAVQQTSPATLRVVQDPHPDFVVRIMEGSSYTVPAGSMLSIKSLGQTRDAGAGGGATITLRINGVDAFGGRATPSPVELTMPVVAAPGDVITVEEQFNDPAVVAVALGYLTRI